MFLELISFLSSLDPGFNVLSYLTVRAVFSMMTALLISLFLGKWIISKLQHYQIGQVIRGDGPESHHVKAGTPTMGGLLILFAFTTSMIIWGDWRNPYLWIVLTTAFIFGAIGFIDDYLKLKRQSPNGLTSKQKFVAQSIGAILIGSWLIGLDSSTIATQLLIPFFKDGAIELGVAGFLIVCYFVIVGSSNAVNLTDGLDGLAIMPVILISGGLAIFAYIGGNYNFSEYLNMPFMPGTGELFVICAALIGSGLAFLWFNSYPAEIFMGDVGALALGASLGLMAVISRHEIVLFIMGGVFVMETASVILQVASFKLTGKRIFRMAPLHHHFELKGWPEPRVIVRFWIITVMLVLFGLATLKLR